MIVLVGKSGNSSIDKKKLIEGISKSLNSDNVKEEVISIDDFKSVKDPSALGQVIKDRIPCYLNNPGLEGFIDFSRSIEYIHQEMSKGERRVFIIDYSLVEFAKGVADEIDRLDKQNYYKRDKLENRFKLVRDINAAMEIVSSCESIVSSVSGISNNHPVSRFFKGELHIPLIEVYCKNSGDLTRHKNIESYFGIPFFLRKMIDKARGRFGKSFKFNDLKYHAVKMLCGDKLTDMINSSSAFVLDSLNRKAPNPLLYQKENSKILYTVDKG